MINRQYLSEIASTDVYTYPDVLLSPIMYLCTKLYQAEMYLTYQNGQQTNIKHEQPKHICFLFLLMESLKSMNLTQFNIFKLV